MTWFLCILSICGFVVIVGSWTHLRDAEERLYL